MANSETYRTLNLFRDQLVLEADYQFGYAVTLRQNQGKELIRGVGSSPRKAIEDLANKWENG
ncbi:hypothetical protein [uncultured Fibrobacter sp.]|uniref:hypothetical protein n=1 Tax=uncultured Fibrobacter sp. TaxID=261512 RepID=UPI0025EC29F6|nr:hypothetical protein [uncultured Fibrobacter sp.]